MSRTRSRTAEPWGARAVRGLALAPLGLAAAAVIALVIGLATGGGATPLILADPGPIVMWGLPVAKLVFNVAASVTIGGLVTAMWITSRTKPEFERAMGVAQVAAGVWLLSGLAVALLTFLQLTALPLSFDAKFGEQLIFVFTKLELGRLWIMQLGMVLVLSIAVVAVRAKWGVALMTVFSLLSLWPLAATGHAAGAANHNLAVGGMTLHLTGAAVWLGGLVVVAFLVAAVPQDRRLPLLERYSTLALVAFIVVAGSGVSASFVNVGSWEGLATPYGGIILAKTATLIVLGLFGAAQRRALIGRLRDESTSPRRPLVWLVTLELAVMGVAAGLAAALGRTPSVVQDTPAAEGIAPTPAEILSGEKLPPQFTPSRLLTEWQLDPIWTLLCLLGITFYVWGVLRLRRRGDAWPWFRTASFITGAAILLYLVNGSLVIYGTFLFSFHMTQHMVLTMLIPIFFVLAAPVTLLLRAVHPRRDGSMGTREWMLAFAHSKWAAFFSNPIVSAVVFAGSLLVFYYTPLFRWAITDHVGHMWMITDFLIVGYLFVQSLIGTDPGPARAPFPMRLLSLVFVMTFHAFFGLSIMTGTGLLMADWFGATGRAWGPDALTDQHVGGALAWGIGEFPTVILALLVTITWMRSDEREQKRRDRRVARDGDVELDAYNAQLRALAERDARREEARAARVAAAAAGEQAGEEPRP